MADYTRSQVGRAAAVLTTAEVAGAALDLAQVHDSQVVIDFSFTLGSLTNVIVRVYASMDGTTYVPVYNGAAAVTETLTATGTRAYALPPLNGYKKMRVTVQGTGTVTNSSATFTYRWLRKGSQI